MTIPIQQSTRDAISNVQQALSDQPEKRDQVVALLTLADNFMQRGQAYVTSAAWTAGLCRDHPQPLSGNLAEQITFLRAWLQMVQPPLPAMIQVTEWLNDAMGQLQSVVIATQSVKEILRKAGDAEIN